jgi:tetratricopeptide (TPR) repeat protein
MSIREGFLASQRNMHISSGLYNQNLPNLSSVKNMNQELQNIFQQANTFHQLGQTQKMIDMCQDALKKYPNCKELHFNQGYGYWKMGHSELAVSSYQRALEIDPEFAAALNNMGLVYLKNNDLENALRCFQKATTGKPPTEDSWLNYAITLTRKGDKRQALAVLASMMEKFPTNKQAALYRGHLHREFREVQEAVNAYNKVLSLDSQNRDALLSLAVISTDVNQKSDAMDAFRRLTELYPKDPEVWKLYGYSLRQLGDVDKSISAFKTALNLDPECVQTMIEQANNHLDKGEAENALTLYDRVLRIDQNQKDSLILKASILADLSNDPSSSQANKSLFDAKKREALACLDRAISVDSSNSDAFLLKGLILKSMGDSDAAIANLGQAISRNNTCAIGYMARAALYWKTKQRTQAKEDIERLDALVMKNATQNTQLSLSPQDEAIQRFLAFYGDSENSLKNLARNRTDISRFGQLQARNVQKVLFLQAQNFEKKSKEEYGLFVETMRRISEVDSRNYKIANVLLPSNSGASPLEQYRTAFLFQSEIAFEHFRDIFLTIQEPLSSDLKKPLAFVDLPTYAQTLAQKFDRQNGASMVLESALKDKSMPIYQFLRGHDAINNTQEETRRYLMFFTGRNPADIDDFTLANIQKLLSVILTSKEHQVRIDKAGSNPDVSDFKRSNVLTHIDDPNHSDFHSDVKSDYQILAVHDALLIRSLMIFYRHRSELQYATSVHDEMAKFLLDRNILFSKLFQFDKVGGSIVNPLTALMGDAHNLERPIMQIDTDPDRILNYVEVKKIKFQIYKNYTPFTTNEIALVFKDHPNQPVVYKYSNHTEMAVNGFVFPQRKKTFIEMTVTINKDHKRSAIVSFQNLVEDEVWISTEVFKGKPSTHPKNKISLFLVKKGI